MNLSEIDRLRIGKFEFTLKPDIWLHTREFGTSREEGKRLEGALSAALRAWYAQPDGYAGMEWQEYLEKTLNHSVQPIMVEPRFQANEIRPAIHKYSANAFNLDKGELLEEAPSPVSTPPTVPVLQVGELRKLRYPEPGEPAKFLIRDIYEAVNTMPAPKHTRAPRATVVHIIFEDGSDRELSPGFIQNCTDPV